MPAIAIFLPNWIGDVVMATPAIRAVREANPGHRIIGVGRAYVRDVVAGSPRFDSMITVDRSLGLDSLHELCHHRPETAILFPNSFRAALFAKLAGCRTIVGFARYFRDVLLTKRLYSRRNVEGSFQPTPAIDEYNRLAIAFGTKPPGHRMELFTTVVDEILADQIWATLGLNRFPRLIGLNPGGAFGASKHWPVEHFAELAKSLVQNHHAGVLILCGPAERENAKRIAGMANHPNVVSLADQSLSIGLTKAIVKRLNLLVTTDSGPRHFATAFGVPAVTLFGPTHIGWTDTYSPRDRNLQLNMPCGPCQKRQCPLGHHRCMTELTPGFVSETVRNILPGGLRRVA